jgi:predicted site-specific integrase-resolvase
MKQTLEIAGKLYDAQKLVQQRFGVNHLTVAKWVKKRLLPTPIKVGGKNFYCRDEVESAFLPK